MIDRAFFLDAMWVAESRLSDLPKSLIQRHLKDGFACKELAYRIGQETGPKGQEMACFLSKPDLH